MTAEFEKATAEKIKCQQEADATNRVISLANRYHVIRYSLELTANTGLFHSGPENLCGRANILCFLTEMQLQVVANLLGSLGVERRDSMYTYQFPNQILPSMFKLLVPS